MLYGICLLFVLIPLIWEYCALKAWRRRVPVRIHVHGTRGKSSATREIARQLRELGMTVLAKTTGDRPEYLLPDGSVEPVKRHGPARIAEHAALLRKAARLHADAVVVEGMALHKETVWFSEIVLRATHAVIVNTRPDHEESMGAGRQGVTETLALMIPRVPRSCRAETTAPFPTPRFFTTAEEGAERLTDLARRNGLTSETIPAPVLSQATALGQAVAQTLPRRPAPPRSVSSAFTTAGSGAAPPFPLRTYLVRENMTLVYYDLFSANDVLSSRLLWDAFEQTHRSCPADTHRVALLATRADRPLRTRAFMDWLMADSRFDRIQPVGDHCGYAMLRGRWHHFFHSPYRDERSGTGPERRILRFLPHPRPERLLESVCRDARRQGKTTLVLGGLGNAHGYGEVWRDFMARVPKFPPPAEPFPAPRAIPEAHHAG